MKTSEGFQPDWASAPGDTIFDILRERDISEAGFASLMGLTTEDTNELLLGQSTVTITVARQLVRTLGSSVEFWMSRDYQYRQDAKRLHEGEEAWLRQLPLGDMIKFGWLSPPPHPSEELAACLRFFAASSVPEWGKKYGNLQEMATFMSTPTFDSRHGAVAAWLRQGEVEAEEIECKSWQAERFQKSLSRIRSLTRQKDPNRFIPTLQKACSENGVAVVIVRSPTGCRASGATRFISNDKAILQLSFRYLTDDHFWFTFFHEAGHLIRHGERHFFSAALEGHGHWIIEAPEAPSVEVPVTEEEREANQFAADTLIPREFQPELLEIPVEGREVMRFSYRVGVSPGIIVGQLQHLGRVGYDQLNELKRRFVWQD